MNKIEIHIITYNEEVMLPVTIAHYKRMFTDPIIIVHDNESTDNTVQIAIDNGCQVIPFKTNGLSDSAYTKIKSQAHLTANADWCLCVDCDEHCYVTDDDLVELESKGVNIVRFEGWDIFANVNSPSDIKEFIGHRVSGYDKPTLVKTGVFSKYLLEPGAHNLQELKTVNGYAVNMLENTYKLIHMKHWNLEFIINRQAEFGRRLSEENRKNGWGVQYTFNTKMHTDYFTNGINNGILITDKRIK
jgi:glycosyltransferase involved in cell wall biosynthesis